MNEMVPGRLVELLEPRRQIGVLALALAVAVAVIFIVSIEAWWTLSFVVLALVIVVIERWPLRRGEAIRIAVGLVGSISLGVLGLVTTLLGMSGSRVPCGPDPCPQAIGNFLFLPGIGLLVAGIVGLAFTIRFIRRHVRNRRAGDDAARGLIRAR